MKGLNNLFLFIEVKILLEFIQHSIIKYKHLKYKHK